MFHSSHSFSIGVLLLLLMAAPIAAYGQGPIDTLDRNDSAVSDTTLADSVVPMVPSNTTDGLTKDPTVAVLSSIIPGGGQLYNEQYWKIPLFVIPAGYFLYRIIDLNNSYLDFAARAAAIHPDSSGYTQLKAQREVYRDDRDMSIVYLVLVEAVGMIDAYVGAHMFDFNVGDDISSRIYPMMTAPGIALQIRF